MFDTLNVRSQIGDRACTLRVVVSSWSAFLLSEDSRGNRLERWTVTSNPELTRHSVYICACDDVVNQLRAGLAIDGAWDSTEFDGRRWTARVRWRGDYLERQRQFFQLLGEVLTIRVSRDVDFAVALDFHSVPPDHEDGRDDWTRTYWGEQMYLGKYKGSNKAGSTITNELVCVAEVHPLLRAAGIVVQVPGTQFKFGERLAKTFASRSDRELVRAQRLSIDHRPAKEGHLSFQLESYEVIGDVAGKAVIIVDDLYLSGVTMRSVAASARAAGATDVYGLVATRAMRKS